jgi:NAD-dependent DNA ligase
MTSNKILTTINRTSYTFSPDNSVEVYIDICPTIKLNNNKILQSIPVSCLDLESDFALANGDKISFTTSNNNLPLLKIVKPSTEERVNVRLSVCPICGEPLLRDAVTGVSRCLNKNCSGQLYNALFIFLASLGISIQGVNYQIIQSLFARDKIHSFVDLFMLRCEQICDDVISPIDASTFIQYIHSVRGHTTVKQLLCGLSIPNMQYTTIDQIQELFNISNWSVLDMCKLLDHSYLNTFPYIDWSAWRDFISLKNNRDLIYLLSTILYI